MGGQQPRIIIYYMKYFANYNLLLTGPLFLNNWLLTGSLFLMILAPFWFYYFSWLFLMAGWSCICIIQLKVELNPIKRILVDCTVRSIIADPRKFLPIYLGRNVPFSPCLHVFMHMWAEPNRQFEWFVMLGLSDWNLKHIAPSFSQD